MEDVTVDKARLIEILRENRDKHRRIFEEALEGYRTRAVQELQHHIHRIKAGKVEKVYVSLPQPEDHTRDYDRVIRMLEMHKADEVVLDEGTFQNYVEDDWNWTRQFLMSSSRFSRTAALERSAKFRDE